MKYYYIVVYYNVNKIKDMKTLKTFLIIVGILIGANAFSQDKIIKNTSDTIFCKITEIGSTEIKYKLPGYPQDLIFGIDVEKVRKVIFDNGMEKTFYAEMNNPENYVNNNKQAIKVNFLSPLYGVFSVGYEKSIKPGRSMEFEVGYIYGPSGIDDQGVILRAGYKFMRTPDFYMNRMKYSHILKGSYIKPEIIFNSFNTEVYNYSSSYYHTNRENATSVSFMLTAGKQVVYDNAFLIDWYFGVGYGFSNNDNVYYYYSNTIITDASLPMSFTAGLKIGILFK